MSRKKGSEFLRGMGKAFEIFKALVDAVLAAGGSDEDIARIKTNKSLLDELVTVVMKYATPVVQPVAAALVATKKSFADLLAACRQDGYCNPDFTEARWPLEPVAADEDDYEVVEHRFTETVTLEEGLCRLVKLAEKGEIRLLTGSRMAMEWVAAHLDVQLNHPVILPLQAQDSDGIRVMPLFDRCWDDVDGRSLGLCDLGRSAYSDCGWLVLRKRDARTLGTLCPHCGKNVILSVLS